MLTDQERTVLDVESRPWRTAGGKDTAIRDTGMTPTRHRQVLVSLLLRADAWEYAPRTLHRTRRILDRRHR